MMKGPISSSAKRMAIPAAAALRCSFRIQMIDGRRSGRGRQGCTAQSTFSCIKWVGWQAGITTPPPPPPHNHPLLQYTVTATVPRCLLPLLSLYRLCFSLSLCVLMRGAGGIHPRPLGWRWTLAPDELWDPRGGLANLLLLAMNKFESKGWLISHPSPCPQPHLPNRSEFYPHVVSLSTKI
jgi:hypothetical protein